MNIEKDKTESIKERMVRKIKKLLRLSKSTNPEEAESAARMASDLMQKYQIDQASVLLKDYEQDEIVTVFYPVEGTTRFIHYVYVMGRAACRLFDGECLVLGFKNQTILGIVGFKSDIPMIIAMFDHFYGSWLSIVEADLEDAKDNSEFDFQSKHSLKFKQGHGVAFSDVLFSRCFQLQQQRKEAVLSSSSTGRALVLLKDDAINRYGEQQKWGRSKRKKISSGSIVGMTYGAESGKNLPLGGGLTSEGAAKRIGTSVE